MDDKNCDSCICKKYMLTEDIVQMKEHLCCIENDVSFFNNFQSLPSNLVSDALHKQNAVMMSMLNKMKLLEKENVLLEQRVTELEKKV